MTPGRPTIILYPLALHYNDLQLPDILTSVHHTGLLSHFPPAVHNTGLQSPCIYRLTPRRTARPVSTCSTPGIHLLHTILACYLPVSTCSTLYWSAISMYPPKIHQAGLLSPCIHLQYTTLACYLPVSTCDTTHWPAISRPCIHLKYIILVCYLPVST